MVLLPVKGLRHYNEIACKSIMVHLLAVIVH